MHVLTIAFVFASAILGTDELVPGVTLISGHFVPGTQPDGNSVVFEGRDGLIVVDTGRHPEHTKTIVDYAREKERPVVAVVNTHWHLDHIGGNPLVRREFPAVRVLATSALDNARKGFLANYRRQLADMIEKTKDPEEQKPWRAEIAIIDSGAALAPDEVLAKSGRRSIAGRDFDVHIEHAATAGDVWLFDRKTRTVVAGDLVTLPAPFLDTACPSGWKEGLDHLSSAPFSILIPGHGKPMTRADFELYRRGFDDLLKCASSQHAREDCVGGWMTDLAPLIAGDDPKFVRSLMSYYVDVLRSDPAVIARRCAG
jgi:glyoxylase-like metal-dependent hydrolase (beta-lactamase superfamily II)